MGRTVNPMQVGRPQTMRMSHNIVNSQMYIVGKDQPLPSQYWMITRIGITMQANAASSGVPPFALIYHAPSGVWENATGALQGVNLIGNGPQGSDMVLCDGGQWPVNGTTNIFPYLIADESHPIFIPENRVPVVYISGYTTTGAIGVVQVEMQYTTWIEDIPKSVARPMLHDHTQLSEQE